MLGTLKSTMRTISIIMGVLLVIVGVMSIFGNWDVKWTIVVLCLFVASAAGSRAS